MLLKPVYNKEDEGKLKQNVVGFRSSNYLERKNPYQGESIKLEGDQRILLMLLQMSVGNQMFRPGLIKQHTDWLLAINIRTRRKSKQHPYINDRPDRYTFVPSRRSFPAPVSLRVATIVPRRPYSPCACAKAPSRILHLRLNTTINLK